ncbi:MAG TPA: Fe-S cluster assembly protein SufD, partial [Acidobacteriota bacterium]|nr:Fe-S cluster assembly protein SufD [Acidobacteriota bacterium]
LMAHPRVLIVAEENSQITVAESHIGISGRYWSNGVTEIVAAENAVVDHYKLQRENDDGYHTATVQAYQDRASSVTTHTVSLTGAIIRNETNAALDGEGCWSELNGLFLVSQDHHVDNFTQLDHLKPNCSSREHYKGILDDNSQGVFRGRIIVARGAQKTDSKQTNNNLLLSDDAIINTKPQLEIYADDVKCTHGATIGQIDRDAIFYLRSRGIDKKAACSILIYAFASEMVRRIKLEELARQLDNYLFEWLPRGEIIRDSV